MADEAGRLPQAIDLRLYAGDSATFTLTITDDDDLPIDATVGQWDAQIKVVGAAAISESFEVTVDPLLPGVVILFLDGDTSQRLGDLDDDDQQRLRWDLQQTFDDSTVTTHAAGFLLVSPDVTRIDLDVTFLVTESGDVFVTELGEELVV